MAYENVGLGQFQDAITLKQRQLHDLSVSIAAAKRTGQTQAEAMLRDQWSAIKAQVDDLIAKQRGSEMPSKFETAVSGIGDWFRGLGGKIALVAGIGLGLVFILPALTRRRSR